MRPWELVRWSLTIVRVLRKYVAAHTAALSWSIILTLRMTL